MKTKAFIWVGLCIQSLFLVYWLLSVPEVDGVLRMCRDELQKGDADLPALTFRGSDSKEVTVVYDRSKSPSENLVARARVELAIADAWYRRIVNIPPVVAFLNVGLFICLLVFCYRRPNKTVQPTAASPSASCPSGNLGASPPTTPPSGGCG